MLDKKYILNNEEEFKKLLLIKKTHTEKEIDDVINKIITFDKERKEKAILSNQLKEDINKTQKQLNEVIKSNINKNNPCFNEETIINIEKLKLAEKKETVCKLDREIRVLKIDLEDILINLPNLPDENTPLGNDENDNIEITKYLNPKKPNFKIKDHTELGEILDGGIDFKSGSILAKSRFTVMKGKVAKLHRALSQFMIDIHTNQHGYTEINVPVVANKETLKGTGQFPKFVNDVFKVSSDGLDLEDMYLIPTAEVPLTNLVRNTKLKENELPLKMVSHSLCFRSEAGSYGMDVKGLIRQHQFEKVELVQIVKPSESDKALDEILAHAEKILMLLGLPYRVVRLCGGDLGFGAKKTYDIEVWVPSQNKYREISSCSNMGDFQARRLNAKVKTNGKTEYVHTLNGSGLAVGRTLLAVLENYQTEYGGILVPDILKPYLGMEYFEKYL